MPRQEFLNPARSRDVCNSSDEKGDRFLPEEGTSGDLGRRCFWFRLRAYSFSTGSAKLLQPAGLEAGMPSLPYAPKR